MINFKLTQEIKTAFLKIMDCFSTSKIKVVGLLLLISLYLPGILFGQTEKKPDQIKLLASLIEKVEGDMQKNSRSIKEGNYKKAREETSGVLNDLAYLNEIFMPLKDRIEQLFKDENLLLLKTRAKESPRSSKADKESLADLQGKNISKTKQAIDLTEATLKNLKKNKPTNQDEANKLQPQIKLREELFPLLKQSLRFQNQAQNQLKINRFQKAVPKEMAAIEKLREALELFDQKQQEDQGQNSQDQSQQNQAHNQPSKDPSDQKQKSSPEENKSSEDQPQQEKKQQNQNQSAGKDSKEEADDLNNSMTAKEALTEIYRIQKENENIMKMREKQFGELRVPGRIPVEKDW
ncbi:MAG: hypothetical protein OEY59_12300 [Deltaproteobacteria bacterium]|nr:hypothetical protein [Deltaproteobacteria bacterium]